MNKELQREWLQFQKSAEDRLRSGYKASQVRLLQLLILPAFEDNIGYEIFKPSRKSGYILARSCWHNNTDSLIFYNPVERLKHPHPLQPTIEQVAVPIPSELALAISNQFHAISMPVFPEKYSWGLDGIAYEVILGSGFLSSRFSWWVEAPPEWQPLETAFHETARLLEEQFTAAPSGS